MALVLLMLILQVTLDRDGFVVAALVLQVATMTAPRVFRPVAVVWLDLSHRLGGVMSWVLLAVVFYGLVTPVGLLRRLLGKDPLRLRRFGRGNASALATRDHTFTARDIEKPY